MNAVYSSDFKVEKHTYSIDLKIYEPANMYEVPFALPESIIDSQGNLKLGTRTIVTLCTEEQFEEICEWCRTHGGILKILGSERLD
jgi:hypothetical protein